MRYNVEFLKKAEDEYLQVIEYLSQFYESTPQKFYNEFEKYKRMLEENPYSFQVCEYAPEYRRAIVMDYLVFYKVNDKTRLVEIHRIFHSSRNINQILEQ
ncbi:MAG: type II toxin-antitoxin system RelE/ParE family toxin [Oscillospiraceae bacterium]|nr:type II toxin-antitoxin system RelE/ParE family toxin [Oscillospiraceae bacterium]